MSWIAEGVEAELVGLAMAHMNGQVVVIVDPVPQPADGKIRVRLPAGSEANVPPVNLKPVDVADVD